MQQVIPEDAPLSRLGSVWCWESRAACGQADPDLFFHPHGERGRARAARQRSAKAVCESCPVRRQCYDHSMRNPEHYGTWGGFSEEERDRIRGSAGGTWRPGSHRQQLPPAAH